MKVVVDVGWFTKNNTIKKKPDVLQAYKSRLKTSLRRVHQDECIRLNHSSSEDVFKTSWSRPIYSSCPYLFKTSSKRFQDVLQKRLQDIFKTSSRRLAKMPSWRWRIVRLNCLPRSRIGLGHTSEKFMVSAENMQVW